MEDLIHKLINDKGFIIFIGLFCCMIIINNHISRVEDEAANCKYATMNLANSLSRLPMYDEVITPTTILEGAYNPRNDYYCVWVKDKTPEEINNTDKHEFCHYLVEHNYDHFCGK